MESPSLISINPATGEPVWQGRAATAVEVDAAVTAARAAFEPWANLPIEQRIKYLHAFAGRLETGKVALSEMISRETGKPRWESLSEVAAMIGKVSLSVEAYHERCPTKTINLPGNVGVIRYKPHGVAAVFGPFNLPGHLPNGHVVPALLAGNTVVFKPSELTPGVGEAVAGLWRVAGLPEGVFNLIQGGRATGEALVQHRGIDAVYFTGSVGAGLAIRRALVDRPNVIVALEMGGNNPLIVHDVADLAAAAYAAAQSAFITAGQRCTCARRLIVPRGEPGDRFIDQLVTTIKRIIVGPYTQEPEPFIGPVISRQAAERLLAAQDDLIHRGGRPLFPLSPWERVAAFTRPGEGITSRADFSLDRPSSKLENPLTPALSQRERGNTAFLSPGLIDVTDAKDIPDAEIFGPLLQLIRVADFDAAIAEANRTAYGLSAGLISDRRQHYETFLRRSRAGVVNWNRQLTNASGRLPFGGAGLSGNHRPSGFFAVDYCAYPVASLEVDRVALPEKPAPGFPTQ